MYYPACFDPHVDGSGRYDVTFTDLPGCVSQGDDLDDALRMAAEALSLHVRGMLEAGDPLPRPSALAQAEMNDRRQAELDGYAVEEGTLWQYVYFEPLRPDREPEPVTLTISLKPAIVGQIDAVAEEMGLSRSGLIAEAARDYISRIRHAGA